MRFLRFAARGSDGDLVALFASDDVSTFQREESDRNVVAAAASDYVSTFHADHVVGGQTIARSWRLRLGDLRERRPTRHARVRVSLGSRRAALNGEAADRPHLPIAELSPSPTARWVDAARPFVPARSVGHFAAQSDCPASDSHESALRTHLSRLPVRARRAVALAQAVYAPSSATPAAPAARHQESGASVAG